MLLSKADEKIAKAFGDQSALTVLQKNHEADVQSLKDVLLAGKRIAAGELEGVEQRARAKELVGKKDVLEQAKGIFGELKKVEGDGLDKSLANVERGVRRMVKGMDIDPSMEFEAPQFVDFDNLEDHEEEVDAWFGI